VGKIIEESIGVVLGGLILLDIFLLILYARANKTIISTELSHFVWRIFIWLSKPLGRWRGFFLTFSGPIILITVLATWALLLSLALALIIHPNLGTAIRTNHGDTPTDFITALYVGGSSLSFIGASDFTPQTQFFQLFYLFTSLIGVSLASLIVTYLMEVYTNLKDRNTLGLKVHLLSAETGDAAEVVAGLGPQGQFDGGYQNLSEWAAETAQVKESHHFYPILFYFRFREPFYSISRTALTSLDTITLIKSALDDNEYGWLKESAAVDHLWRGTLMQLRTLAENFIPNAEIDVPPDPQTRARWKRRYADGVERLQGAGIKTANSGEEVYISLRTHWDRYITLLAPKFAYEMDEIDTALAKVK
jgi:hypothetical protein